MKAYKNKKLYLLAGCPGAGKSYWIQNHLSSFHGHTKVVSRDEIRFSFLKEDDEYFSKENIVYSTFIEEIKDGLLNYDNTIADATHLNIPSRAKLLNALGNAIKNIEVIIITFETPLAVCLNRNEKREGRSKVPRSVVRRMFYSFEMPTFEEGFDQIITYSKVGNEVIYTMHEREEKI